MNRQKKAERRIQRAEILDKVTKIEREFCKGCSLGNANNDRYCKLSCEHGAKLREYGSILLGAPIKVSTIKDKKKAK